MARGCAGKPSVTQHEIAAMLFAGLAAVQKRGKAERGDKTMVDALAPAVEAAQNAIAANRSLRTALAETAEAAQVGAESTKNLIARFGRAKFLGERSLGFQDAGATSISIMLAAFAEMMKGDA
jgi:dihydroxyacetone kinase-like protein